MDFSEKTKIKALSCKHTLSKSKQISNLINLSGNDWNAHLFQIAPEQSSRRFMTLTNVHLNKCRV